MMFTAAGLPLIEVSEVADAAIPVAAPFTGAQQTPSRRQAAN